MGFTKQGTPRKRAAARPIIGPVLDAARPRVLAGESARAVALDLGVGVAALTGALIRSGLRCTRQGNGRAPADLQLPSDVASLAYIAGLFDGEGCLKMQRKVGKRGRDQTTWHLDITNTYEPVIDWLAQFGGAKQTYVYSNRKYKTRHNWVVSRQRSVVQLLNALLPYLQIKRDVALEAIDDITSREIPDGQPTWVEADEH